MEKSILEILKLIKKEFIKEEYLNKGLFETYPGLCIVTNLLYMGGVITSIEDDLFDLYLGKNCYTTEIRK